MIQAQKCNNTNHLSRRSALAGLAGVAAAGVAVAALPAGASVIERDRLDWPGILARAEHMIATLRRSYGSENWATADEEAAARTLQYFRACAAGLDDEEEWGATIEFFGVHGQSFDWIFCGDPVTMIHGMAAHSHRAAMADPVFAVIEEHRAAHLGLHAACLANDLDIKECPNKTAAEERQMAAELPLFTTAPATALGVAALLEYLASPAASIGEDDDDRPEPDGSIFTIMSYAQLWLQEDLADAVRRFPVRMAEALRAIAGIQS
jgi:hypothetical protein